MSLAEKLPPRGSEGSLHLAARTGGALIIVGGLVSIAMAGLDPHPVVNLVAGALGLVCGVYGLVVKTEGKPESLIVAVSAIVTLLISSVPASIHRPGDLGTGPVFYMWVVMHASVFMSRRDSRGITAWACVLYLGIVYAELPPVMATASAVTMVIALSALQVVTEWLRDGIDTLVGNLQEQAERDNLTGLLNRQGLVERIQRAGTDGGSGHGALLILDVDHFKQINDRFGHAVGDETLSWLGTVLEADALEAIGRHWADDNGKTSGETSGGEIAAVVPARFGGEEFVVWLEGADQGQGAAWAEQLRKRILESSVDRQRPLAITVSVGVAAGSTEDLTGLLNRADHALYRAKDSGRNRVRVAPSPAEPATA